MGSSLHRNLPSSIASPQPSARARRAREPITLCGSDIVSMPHNAIAHARRTEGKPSRANRLLACGWAAAEADDVAIRVLDIEALRAPLGRRDRLDDRHAVGDALLVERLDAVNARRGVEMIVVAPVLAVRLVLGRFLQVKFQSVQNPDRVEPFPWLAEREADLLVVRDRALKVVDKKLWSERCHTRLHRANRSLSLLLQKTNERHSAASG